MPTYFAEELTAAELAGFITADTVGILPVAAIAPHGPHLPLSTDCEIARGLLSHVPHYAPDAVDVVILPLMTMGNSLEHSGFAGNFTHRAELLLEAWMDVARVFQVAGGRRLIIVTSHSGNAEVVSLLVTRLRAQFAMLAVGASWMRFGAPPGLFDDREPAYGVHGGEIETSLMLHYWPEAVRTERVHDFASTAEAWDMESKQMRLHGPTRQGWITADLNTAGAVGNAAAASGKKGAALAHYILARFAELIEDVARFEITRLREL